jgi:hypothetical protein
MLGPIQQLRDFQSGIEQMIVRLEQRFEQRLQTTLTEVVAKLQSQPPAIAHTQPQQPQQPQRDAPQTPRTPTREQIPQHVAGPITPIPLTITYRPPG